MSEFNPRGLVSGGVAGSKSQPYTKEAAKTNTTTTAGSKFAQHRQRHPNHGGDDDFHNHHKGDNYLHVQKEIDKDISTEKDKVEGSTAMDAEAESLVGGMNKEATTQLALGCGVGVGSSGDVGRTSKETATQLALDVGAESLGSGVGLGYVNAASGGYSGGDGGYGSGGGHSSGGGGYSSRTGEYSGGGGGYRSGGGYTSGGYGGDCGGSLGYSSGYSSGGGYGDGGGGYDCGGC
jgi:hypothetical protein